MSRVDEALRRAAEISDRLTIAPEPALFSSVDAEDVDTLAQEPFPVETTDRRRVRHAARVPLMTDAAGSGTQPLLSVHSSASDVLSRIEREAAEKLVVGPDIMPVSREQYRRLAAALHSSQETTGLKVIMVASATAQEGKTLTVSNIGLTLSESYQRRVLLIDADLRRPTLHQMFGIAASAGLSEGLASVEQTTLVARQVSPRLTVLPGGRPSIDPMAGLTSARMHRLIEEARGAFDWVIIDTPPLMLLSDASLLISMVDSVILVVRADSTPHDFVQRAVASIGTTRLLGVVLNSARADQQPGYAEYPGYYRRVQAIEAKP